MGDPARDRGRAAARAGDRRRHDGRAGGTSSSSAGARRAATRSSRSRPRRSGVLHADAARLRLRRALRTPVFLVTDKELNLTPNTVAVDGYARPCRCGSAHVRSEGRRPSLRARRRVPPPWRSTAARVPSGSPAPPTTSAAFITKGPRTVAQP